MLREISLRTRWYLGVLTLSLATASMLASIPAVWGGFVATELIAGVLLFILWRRNDISLPIILALAVVFRLFFLWLPPVLSDDAYRYVWDGLVQMEGINPFAHRPADSELVALRSEHVYSRLNSSEYYTVYPPVSQLIFRIGTSFYNAGWLSSYYVIKALLGTCEVGALWILSRRLEARRFMLYAWNPLVILSATGQAHTDAAAVFFLVLAWTLADRGRGGWSSVALAAAGLVKLYPFVLLPLLWRRFGWNGIWPAFLTVLVLSLPYYHADAVSNVVSSLDLYVRYFEFNAGIYYGIKKLFSIVTGDDWSKQIGPALRWLFLASLPVIYYLDARRNWPLRRAFVVTIGLFFICSTTVHPWYLLPLVALVSPARPPSWHWYWLAVASLGTYLLYVESYYWIWVILGWFGWAVLGVSRYIDPVLDKIIHRRAHEKLELMADFLDIGGLNNFVLDLGTGEGYVGQEIAERTGAHVILADITDLNRTELPLVVYDGNRLPFAEGQFHLVVLVYVLHHAASPNTLVAEAARVSGGRIIILESTYTNQVQRSILTVLDYIVNYVRSSGRMSAGQHKLDFRTLDEWTNTFRAAGLNVEIAHDLGGLIHRRALFVLSKTSGTVG